MSTLSFEYDSSENGTPELRVLRDSEVEWMDRVSLASARRRRDVIEVLADRFGELDGKREQVERELIGLAVQARDDAPERGEPSEEEEGVRDPASLLEEGREVLDAPDQLALLRDSLSRLGYAGSTEAAELVHVALSSRALERPLGLALHGPSAAGKTFTAQVASRHHPEDALHDVSAMSERYLAYADFPTEHRYVSIAEASALHNDGVGATIIRELSWNRRLRYGTVVRTEEGPQAVTIEKPGPTGLITTSTKPLDEEIATRLIAVHITDRPEQTRKVVEELAREAAGRQEQDVDLSAWHAASDWLVTAGDREVVVPYAGAVAERVPVESVRMRRDMEQIFTVIRALAFMHQRTRPRDGKGRIVATREDYANAHRILAETMAVTLNRVSEATRETVEAVASLNGDDEDGDGAGAGVAYHQLAGELGLSKSGAWRRAQVALDDGYLANTEERAGYPARLVTADPLPEPRAVLPDPEGIPPREDPPKSTQRLNASGESAGATGKTTVEDPDSTVGGVDSTPPGCCEGGLNGPTAQADGEKSGSVEALSGNQGVDARGTPSPPEETAGECRKCGLPTVLGRARCHECTGPDDCASCGDDMDGEGPLCSSCEREREGGA